VTWGVEVRTVTIIPALNEAKTIGQVVADCLTIVDTVVVVNDASTDATASRARSAGAIVIDLPQHSGVGHALSTGFKWALEQNIEFVVTLDADGAHDPGEVPSMIQAHQAASADLTIGSRFMQKSPAFPIPTPKRWANYFAAFLVNCITGQQFTDVACGLRILGCKALELPCDLAGFGALYDQIFKASFYGLVIQQVPVSVRYDAREILCTRQHEFLHLLNVCRQWAPNPEFSHAISVLAAKVAGNESHIPVVLRGQNIANQEWSSLDVIHLHYLPEHKSYIFQMQDPYFTSLSVQGDAEAIILNKPDTVPQLSSLNLVRTQGLGDWHRLREEGVCRKYTQRT